MPRNVTVLYRLSNADGIVVRRRTLTSALTEDASARHVRDDLPTLHDFESIEEARDEIDACIERYNRGWLLERHG